MRTGGLQTGMKALLIEQLLRKIPQCDPDLPGVHIKEHQNGVLIGA